MNEAITTARKLLQQHSRDLLSRPNVVATGVGFKVAGDVRSDTPSIICSVRKKVAAAALSSRDLVPRELDGVPTDVIETGRIRAFQAPTGRFRPAPGGVSVGHREITAGTLGCWVRREGQWMMLSNNHVLANSNDAEIGDPILQPGPFDSGRYPGDQIAVLEDFVPIKFPGDTNGDSGGCGIAGTIVSILNGIAGILDSSTRVKSFSIQQVDNLVDAAIGRPLNEEDVLPEILNIGTVAGTASADLGTAVKKSGRTTGFTQGEILQVDVTVDVQYGTNLVARFTDQLMAGAMSQGGDSGSAVLDNQNRLVGLLFAGSDQTTIINRIEHVFDALDLSL
ncbi:MAG: hypothetical protein JSV26_09215 [bacterium]|nr:MAG: hypothetical protein JSV26_09215 [bacterium]